MVMGNTIHVKKNAAPLFGKKSRLTYMVCTGSAGIRNCGAFFQTHHNPAKGAAILVLRHFTRRQSSKCSAFGGRKAAHMLPCFQVPLRHVCCILFDTYCMYGRRQKKVSRSIRTTGARKKKHRWRTGIERAMNGTDRSVCIPISF